MEVKTDAIRTLTAEAPPAAAGVSGDVVGPANWWDLDEVAIDGRTAARILEWNNTNSVRNRARLGGFRWRQRGNGRLVYHRGDVEEYAARLAAAQPTTDEAA